jgi:hypothetical protein
VAELNKHTAMDKILSVAPMLDWTDNHLQRFVFHGNKCACKVAFCNIRRLFNATALPMAFVDTFIAYNMALLVF